MYDQYKNLKYGGGGVTDFQLYSNWNYSKIEKKSS